MCLLRRSFSGTFRRFIPCNLSRLSLMWCGVLLCCCVACVVCRCAWLACLRCAGGCGAAPVFFVLSHLALRCCVLRCSLLCFAVLWCTLRPPPPPGCFAVCAVLFCRGLAYGASCVLLCFGDVAVRACRLLGAAPRRVELLVFRLGDVLWCVPCCFRGWWLFGAVLRRVVVGCVV